MEVGTELERGRFRILALLGAGAMGRVYHARDALLERDVALKTFHRPAPDDLYALKHEFRALAGCSHPHVVQLYELFSDAEHCFFTMEMIDGEPLLEYVRRSAAPGAALDDGALQRLRQTFRQLVSGLRSVHEAGQMHRDLKPSNVLVNAEGHAVLIDFGLATLGRQALQSEGVEFAGTLAYAAPEQAWGHPPSPAADWYALGATLFETLTGCLPFEGSVGRVVHAKELAAPRASAVAAGTPARLDELTRGLMAHDPEHRPGTMEILEALAEPSAAKPAPTPTEAVAPFVGRGETLARLVGALERSGSGPSVIFVRGSSGIGKTEVVRRFAEDQRRKGALVLSGRCRHQESVAYRALDPLIDELSQRLVRLPENDATALVPRFADALVRLFPVLARVPLLSHAPTTGAASDDELLRRGSEALRELLARIADRRSLILWIDDAQWGDRGSIALLRSLLRPPDAPHLLLILSYRVEDEQAGVLVSALRENSFGHGVGEETLSLGPLSEAECRQLVEELAASGVSLSERQRRMIVDESAGSPFFLIELFRHTALSGGGDAARPGVERVLEERLQPLSSDARAVLDLVAVAGRPVATPFILDVAGVGAAGRPLVLDLCAQSLLRMSGREDAGEIETYHDRIRELVLGSLSEDDRRRRHRQIADGLRAQAHADPRALVEHYLGAGENGLAAEYAERAALDASSELAFDRAADLYSLAIRLHGKQDGDYELEVRRAEALANAGRGAEAGDAYVAAAEAIGRVAPDPDRQARLVGFAAEHYLYAGHWRAGLERTREVMRHLGIRLPATSRDAMRRANLLRLRFFLVQKHRRFHKRPVRTATRDRLGALFGTSKGMALVLPKLSDFLGILYLHEALAAGDSEHAAIALAKEASIEGALRGPRWRRRGARLIETARRIAGDSAEPHVRGTILTCQGALHYFSAEWERAVHVCEQAVDVFRNECVGQSQSTSITISFLLPSLAQRGDLDRMRRLIPEFLEDARRRGDLTASNVLLAGDAALVALARDDPKDAIDTAERLIELASHERQAANPYDAYLATWRAELYAGQVDNAWRRTVEAWERLTRVGFTTFEMYAVILRSARAATALACAAHGGMPDTDPAELEKLAMRDVRWLERSKLANAAPLAASLRASLAALRGDASAQRTALERAMRGFERAAMPLHANACALHLGGAEAGPALAWMEERQVRNARALARAIVPGAWI